MRHSKIVLATMSTLLRENLALNRKTLSCNFTKDDNYNFPVNGICSLKEPCNFEKFSFRLKSLLNILFIINIIYFPVQKLIYLIFIFFYNDLLKIFKKLI